jgi:transketolase
VIEVNGHEPEEISEGLDRAKKTKDVPSILIAHTVKGKGVSFMENTHVWHGKQISEQEYAQAVSELAEAIHA